MDTIECMRTFAAVAAERSFTVGARRLGMSAKLASKYVRQLEARLGAQLFNRTTRSVALTDVGRAYLDRCVSLLQDFEETEAAVQDQHATPAGRIRMTAPTAFGEQELTRALASFLREHPAIQIDLDLTNRHVSLVEEGYDLGIRISNLADSTMIARKLASMRVVLCASPDYLARAGRPEHPGDLANHACIIDTNYRDAPNWPFVIGGRTEMVRVDGPFSVNTPLATCEMATAGLGVALCANYVARHEVEAGRLEVLLADHEAHDFGVYAIYPHNRHLMARIRVLVDHLAQCFRDL